MVVDEEVLEEAMRLTGERSQSAVIRRALEDLVRRARSRQMLDLAGSGAWEGDLGVMRGDAVHEDRRTGTGKRGRGRGPR